MDLIPRDRSHLYSPEKKIGKTTQGEGVAAESLLRVPRIAAPPGKFEATVRYSTAVSFQRYASS